jgi:peptidoglycan/LPS O-acetylase OafA/YrhL
MSSLPPPVQPKKSQLPHLPELDSLRTLAVFMTLLAHFSPVDIPYMWYGVPIFFTISGFLITTILLKTYYSEPDIPRVVMIKNFMVRRTLRLFPIYYLLIFTFFLAKKYFSLYLWKDEFNPYFFTYTPNFLIHQIGYGKALCFAHLWSLGVEEQFYLFWPWIILFCPGRFKLQVIFGLIVFALTYRTINYKDAVVGALPFANMHTLGAGAVLAWLYVRREDIINRLKEKRHLIFCLTFIHLVIVLIFFRDNSAFWHLYREVALCLCTFSIVLVSIYGWKGFAGYISRNKQVQYIGTISYGIYLYHMPVPFVYRAIAARAFPHFHMPDSVFLVFCFVVTIALAAFSYRFIETPFLKLKRYFAY